MSFFPALLAFMAVISPTIVADFANPDLRHLEAYTEPNFEGPVQQFLDYVPDLSDSLIDNAIESVCFTGFWFLFSEANYQGTSLGDFYGVNMCQNLITSSLDKASSLRYAGSPYGLDDVYYNLYENTYYSGAEFKGNTNVGSLEMNVSSLAITGQSPWTFFTEQEYTGPSFCLYPGIGTADGIDMHYNHVPTMESVGLPGYYIQSVAKGCLSERIVQEPHSTRPMITQ